MTNLQMSAELFRQLSIIAEDETLMAKLLKYTKRLTATKKDPTLMTREEFVSRVKEAKKGPTHSMLVGEDLTSFLRRRGYGI